VAIAEGAAAASSAAANVSAGTAAAGTGAAGAAGSGAMATLSTLAAPIAIGLGVAFLLNKLFD
jgi:hypothetical protein